MLGLVAFVALHMFFFFFSDKDSKGVILVYIGASEGKIALNEASNHAVTSAQPQHTASQNILFYS